LSNWKKKLSDTDCDEIAKATRRLAFAQLKEVLVVLSKYVIGDGVEFVAKFREQIGALALRIKSYTSG
jgi:hypothetical protein